MDEDWSSSPSKQWDSDICDIVDVAVAGFALQPSLPTEMPKMPVLEMPKMPKIKAPKIPQVSILRYYAAVIVIL